MSAKTESGAPVITGPRTPYNRVGSGARPNGEMISWIFMRASGVVLIVLIFGHLWANLWVGDGVNGISFAFVAGKWADIRWQIWDLAMLWLAMLHGSNGVKTIINDYAEKPMTRQILKVVLYAVAIFTIVLGTLVIFTFDPCPTGGDPALLPSFCQG